MVRASCFWFTHWSWRPSFQARCPLLQPWSVPAWYSVVFLGSMYQGSTSVAESGSPRAL